MQVDLQIEIICERPWPGRIRASAHTGVQFPIPAAVPEHGSVRVCSWRQLGKGHPSVTSSPPMGGLLFLFFSSEEFLYEMNDDAKNTKSDDIWCHDNGTLYETTNQALKYSLENSFFLCFNL